MKTLGKTGSGSLDMRLREFEKAEIEAALHRNHGNVAAAARELGRHRTGLAERMRTLEIERPLYTPSTAIACPRCNAPAGESCRHPGVAHRRRAPHAERSVLLQPAGEEEVRP